uniref:Putative sigma-70 region domain containing protein n=1 Tax=viral metagenome TaxID=1070528 RepID=A0A6M3J4K5_9ZZZZ
MAKYDSLRKPKRDAELFRYWKGHQELSQKEIGKHFGISHARVSQILKKEGGKNASEGN